MQRTPWTPKARPPGERSAAEVVIDDALDTALDGERARAEQVPPAFSAISVDGQRAHRLARRGEAVELKARPVSVRALTIVERSTGAVTVDLSVSKGYYVRAFARDLGVRLGVPSHLSFLERRASGPYRIEDAVAWPTQRHGTSAPAAAGRSSDSRALPLVASADSPRGTVRAWHGKLARSRALRRGCRAPPGVAIGLGFWPGRRTARRPGKGRMARVHHRVLRGFHQCDGTTSMNIA